MASIEGCPHIRGDLYEGWVPLYLHELGDLTIGNGAYSEAHRSWWLCANHFR